MISTYCTVKPSRMARGEGMALGTSESLAPREKPLKPLGFCRNSICSWRVKGSAHKKKIRIAMAGNTVAERGYMTDNAKTFNCDHCGHALFWTIRYRYVGVNHE